MGLRLIYGKSGSGKSTYCFSEIARLIEKENEKKIFIITPEQFSFTAERKLMDEMGKLGSNAAIYAEVVTLSRMAYRVMQEVGGDNEHLSKCGKAMLIYSILSNNQKNLKFLGKTDENIDLSMRAITEFKKHGVVVEDLISEIDKTEDLYLKNKLQDMVCIYQNFEEKISGRYIEDTDLLTILAENLRKVDLVKDSIIFIDEFAGFTYQEYQVIKEMLKLAKEVNITMCVDDLDFNTNPDIDIYYPNKLTVKRLLDLARENDIGTEEFVHLDTEHRFKPEELKFLSNNLYNPKSTKYGKDVENLKLFLAKNEYSEVEEVAKKIQKLVREENMHYKDISIITKDIEGYSSLVRVIFREYDIPVFIDEKRDLNQNIIVQYVLSILEILVKNFSSEAIFSYIKLGFLDYDKEEIFKLENYCNKWGIKLKKWKKDFTYELDDENKKKEVERLNEIRKEIINPLIKLQEDIRKEKTAKNITKVLYNFLISQNIEKKVEDKIKELEENNLVDLANEYKESYQIILDIFDEIVLIFDEDKMTIDKYQKILKIGLKNSGLGKIPGTADQVILGDVDRSRTHKVKAVFILGLNDGSFPSNSKDEGFLDDNDREILKQDGIELAKGTIEQLYDDKFNIYKAFTTAEEKIYLSYSSSDKDGKSLRPSVLITQIKKMYPKLKEESDVISKKYEIVNKEVTYEELIENIAKIRNKEEIDKVWYQIYNYYKNDEEWKQKLQKDLEGLKYTNIPEDIKQENIDKLYGNTLKTSISRLEKYRGCPFSYYLRYGLKLKEKEELKIQSFNTGSFMHETIDNFFEYVKQENLNLAEIEEDKILEIVSKIIEESLSLNKNFIFTATTKYKVLVRRLKRIVAKALKYIIQTIIYSDFNVEGTEVEFSEKGKYKPIILELEDGKKIEITGKIDRIDTATNEDGKYLRIIDYKSSAKNIDLNEVYAGLQIQLLTYTDAICRMEDIVPAGIFYFSLLEQMADADKRIDEEEIEEMIRKNFKMKGLIIADVKIIKMNDNTLDSGTTSMLVPAGITKQGGVSARDTRGVKQEEFKVLQDYIYKTIKDISKEILSGKIDLKPYKKQGETPCRYCEYKTICSFNPRLKNNKYNYIDKKSKDEILMKMKNETKRGRAIIVSLCKNVNVRQKSPVPKCLKGGKMDLSNENVIHVKKDGVEYLQFRKLLEYKDIINHAYSLGTNVNFRTATVENKVSKEEYKKTLENYKFLCNEIGSNYINIVKPIQRHTDNVKIISKKINKEAPDFSKKEYENTDGLITNKSNLVLCSTSADCISLLFFDPVKKVIANVHSGWKGTLQRISIKTVEKMVDEFNCKPEDIICCICPSIRKCHFEVEQDVKNKFEYEFQDLGIDNLKEIIEEKIPNKKWNIDTVLINKIILKRKGLKEENIIDSKICTVCNSEILHSYRAEKENYGLNAALIELKGE